MEKGNIETQLNKQMLTTEIGGVYWIDALHKSIDLCKETYGDCSYMEMSKPLYAYYKNTMFVLNWVPTVQGESSFGYTPDIRERVEIVLTDDEEFYWKALKEKDSQGVRVTIVE
ncbi:hypothetical protein [Bacillus phage BvP]